MKKENAALGMAVCGVVCLAAGAMSRLSLLEAWVCALLIVAAFPFFVVFLGLWWKASEREGDIPFIGY